MPKKLVFIQILREISIFLVLLTHFSLPNALMEKLPLQLTNPGYIGVELFFVISGFVVTRSLQKNNYNLPKFICSRIFRLYPALILFIASAWLVRGLASFCSDTLFIQQLFGGDIVNYAAQSFGVLTGTLINITNSTSYSFGAMWSLSVEFQFYTTLALLLCGKIHAKLFSFRTLDAYLCFRSSRPFSNQLPFVPRKRNWPLYKLFGSPQI